MKVMVIESVHASAVELLGKSAEVVFPEPQNLDGILKAIVDCDGLIARGTAVTREVMEAAPKLKVIGRHGVGYDSVDIAAATDLHIPVVYTPAANTESVAELAAGFIICAGRKVIEANRFMQTEKLLSDTVTMQAMTKRVGLVNANIGGKTLGIIGVGRIGSLLAKKMIAGFGMKVFGYDPYVDAKTLAGYGVNKVDKLEDMLPLCDFVSLHCPGGGETRKMINAATLALMKSNAYLINTARGTVVDEAALVQAVQSKKIAGAATDVYDPEPPVKGSPIIHEDAIIVTPHIGAQTEESLVNMGRVVVQEVLSVLEGRKPQFFVNPEVWENRRK
jgi:D-3-phosphoglycerate dehydrogenase